MSASRPMLLDDRSNAPPVRKGLLQESLVTALQRAKLNLFELIVGSLYTLLQGYSIVPLAV